MSVSKAHRTSKIVAPQMGVMTDSAAMHDAVNAVLAEFAQVAADFGVSHTDIDRFTPDIARRLCP